MGETFRRVSYLLLIAALVAVGTGFRLAAGSSAVGKPTPAPGASLTTPAISEGDAATAAQTVLDFYKLIDEGSFEEASALTVEIQWQWQEGGDPAPVSLKSRERFVADSEQELGARGGFISIFEAFAKTDRSAPADPISPELDALRGLAGAPKIDRVAWVDTNGTVKLNCGIRGWSRRMAVVETAGSWKLLLPRPDLVKHSRVQAWFPASGPIIIRP